MYFNWQYFKKLNSKDICFGAQALLNVWKLLLLSALTSSALWPRACMLVTFALNRTPYPSGLLGLYSLGIVEYCGYLVVENLLALAPPLLGADTSCLALWRNPKRKPLHHALLHKREWETIFHLFFFLFLIRLGVQHPLVPARPHRQDKKKHLMRSTRLVKGVARETNNKLLMYFPWKNIPCGLLESCQIKYLVIQ